MSKLGERGPGLCGVPTLQGNPSLLQQHGRGDTRSRRGLGSTRHKRGHMGNGGAAFIQPQRGAPFQSVQHMGPGTAPLSSSPVT